MLNKLKSLGQVVLYTLVNGLGVEPELGSKPIQTSDLKDKPLMGMFYAYTGTAKLTEQEAKNAADALREYPYALEVSGNVPNDVLNSMEIRRWWQESDMDGKMYQRETTLYRTSHVGKNLVYYLKSQEDLDHCLAAVRNNGLVNAEPFRSFFR